MCLLPMLWDNASALPLLAVRLPGIGRKNARRFAAYHAQRLWMAARRGGRCYWRARTRGVPAARGSTEGLRATLRGVLFFGQHFLLASRTCALAEPRAGIIVPLLVLLRWRWQQRGEG